MTLYRVVHSVAGPAVRTVWRLEVLGAENVPDGPAIVVANHDSLSDPFFLGAAVDRPLRFLAKRELWRNGLVGRVLDGLGAIPVERSRGDVGAVAVAAQGARRRSGRRDLPAGNRARAGRSRLAAGCGAARADDRRAARARRDRGRGTTSSVPAHGASAFGPSAS